MNISPVKFRSNKVRSLVSLKNNPIAVFVITSNLPIWSLGIDWARPHRRRDDQEHVGLIHAVHCLGSLHCFIAVNWETKLWKIFLADLLHELIIDPGNESIACLVLEIHLGNAGVVHRFLVMRLLSNRMTRHTTYRPFIPRVTEIQHATAVWKAKRYVVLLSIGQEAVTSRCETWCRRENKRQRKEFENQNQRFLRLVAVDGGTAQRTRHINGARTLDNVIHTHGMNLLTAATGLHATAGGVIKADAALL